MYNGRLTLVWEYFGTLRCELFIEIVRSYVDKLIFLNYADNFNPIRSGGGALKAPPSDFFLSRI